MRIIRITAIAFATACPLHIDLFILLAGRISANVSTKENEEELILSASEAACA
jgi:hypothetical protein